MAAMQRVRMNLPEPPDSASLKAYPIYDYLLAARLRRDLGLTPSEELDATIDAFLRAREGAPVGRSLKHQWLASLAQRQRWDWLLPRSADATDPQLSASGWPAALPPAIPRACARGVGALEVAAEAAR